MGLGALILFLPSIFPSFLPSWPVLGSTALTTGVGETPQPHRQDVSSRVRPGVRRGRKDRDTQGQTYPLIQIEGLWGGAERGRRADGK